MASFAACSVITRPRGSKALSRSQSPTAISRKSETLSPANYRRTGKWTTSRPGRSVAPAPHQKDCFMSLLRESLCAFAAGAVVCCVVYAATALPAETRASIDNFMFKPDTITVPVGIKVVWQNDDEIPHTVTSVDATFHSPPLDTKDKFSFPFDKPRTFESFCPLHPFMKGKIVVAS